MTGQGPRFDVKPFLIQDEGQLGIEDNPVGRTLRAVS